MSDQGGGPINRELQRNLLLAMRDRYPNRLHQPTIPGDVTVSAFHANLLYLEEHGLCEAGLGETMSGYFNLSGAKITARGLDFLADDGGLSAILGVVTVRLHADTIRDLIAAKIEASTIPEPEKASLKKRLAALPEMALGVAAKDLVRQGLDHLPDVVHWVRALADMV